MSMLVSMGITMIIAHCLASRTSIGARMRPPNVRDAPERPLKGDEDPVPSLGPAMSAVAHRKKETKAVDAESSKAASASAASQESKKDSWQVGSFIRTFAGKDVVVAGKEYYNTGEIGRIVRIPTEDDGNLVIEWPRTGLRSMIDTNNPLWTTAHAVEELNPSQEDKYSVAVAQREKLDDIKSASSSHYFGPNVQDLGFLDMWAMLRDKVPLSRLQSFRSPGDKISYPVCHPTLVGPAKSSKLAILLHGFLSCPGTWFRLVPLLVEAGFRVMLPTLPGHGRDPGKSAASSDEGVTNTTGEHAKWEDDLSDMPTSAEDYIEFAYALQKLAAQFKRENPQGLVVAVGHSLGAAVTAKYAMEIPDVVDRVLLLNPMFGLASKFVETFARTLPTQAFSKGAGCEKKRNSGSGGTCQFRLEHVNTMSQFAYAVLCCHWGLEWKCKKNGYYNKQETCAMFGADRGNKMQEGFGAMRGFQVVTTRGDGWVDNMLIKEFLKDVRTHRANTPHGYTSKVEADFCYWPSDLGHSYIGNYNRAGKEKWWHPYVENVITQYLAGGWHIDIVRHAASGTGDCLSTPQDVDGDFLAMLPAVEHTGEDDTYWIGNRRDLFHLDTIFRGSVHKESWYLGKMHERHVELLKLKSPAELLIVTRLAPNANIRDIFLLRNNFVVLEERKAPSDKMCVRPDMYQLSSTSKPLRESLDDVAKNGIPISVLFCADLFVKALCQALACAEKVDGVATL